MAEENPESETGVGRWIRLFVFLLTMVALVVVPFVLWGEQMDSRAPRLVEDQPTKWAIALVGVGLLVVDVLFPVPSSVVSITLCLLLGPVWGGAAVFVGMVGAFAVGFVVGALLPSARLRQWVGPALWDTFAAEQLTASLIWIAMSRPLPVLAEVTALFAGSVRMPFALSIGAAALSSLLVALVYALAAGIGLHESAQADRNGSSLAVLVVTAAFLPAVSWAVYRCAHKWLLRRRLEREHRRRQTTNSG